MNRIRSRCFAVLTALWLLGVIFPPTLDSTQKDLLQAASLLWIFILGACLGGSFFLVGPLIRQRPGIGGWIAAGILALSVGALLSDDPGTSLLYVGTTIVGLSCCSGLWEWIGSEIDLCLGVFSGVGSCVIAYFYATAGPETGRLSLSPTAHANHLGLVAFGILMGSLAFRRVFVRLAAITISVAVIVATQSRGSLVAGGLGLLIYAALRLRTVLKARQRWILASSVVAVSLVLILYQEQVERAVASLLFLDDRYRGLGTGFTGRLDAWREAFALFQDNVWFGVGYRMHERYMTTLSSAHSGYLSMLAETGAIGTVCLLTLTAVCAWRQLRMALAGDRVAALGTSLVCGYLFLAAFERYFVNMGNPTSMLVWLMLLRPVPRPSLQRSSQRDLGGRYARVGVS